LIAACGAQQSNGRVLILIEEASASPRHQLVVLEVAHPLAPLGLVELAILRFLLLIVGLVGDVEDQVYNLGAYLDIESAPLLLLLPSESLMITLLVVEVFLVFLDLLGHALVALPL